MEISIDSFTVSHTAFLMYLPAAVHALYSTEASILSNMRYATELDTNFDGEYLTFSLIVLFVFKATSYRISY
jgi:hypothetical protein